jgi:hypothetical protein
VLCHEAEAQDNRLLPHIGILNYADGGLMCFGINLPDQLRRSGAYIDLILKGASPSPYRVAT